MNLVDLVYLSDLVEIVYLVQQVYLAEQKKGLANWNSKKKGSLQKG